MARHAAERKAGELTEMRFGSDPVAPMAFRWYRGGMDRLPPGAIAVIFQSRRSDADDAGYARAAEAMEMRAATMPGYLGLFSTRGPEGLGITVSWWRDREAAMRWRDDPEHAAIRERGRAVWYDWYRLTVAEVERDYEWSRGLAVHSPTEQ